MQTFLPHNYIFTPQESYYQDVAHYAVYGPNKIIQAAIWTFVHTFLIGILICGILIFVSYVIKRFWHKDLTKHEWPLLIQLGLLMLLLAGNIGYDLPIQMQREQQKVVQQNQFAYNAGGFKLKDSNFIIFPAKYRYGKNNVLKMTDRKPRAYYLYVADYGKKVKTISPDKYDRLNYEYGKQMRFTTPQVITQYQNTIAATPRIAKPAIKIHYVGKVQQGLFVPGQTAYGILFSRYQNYVIKHHLTKYFTKSFYFRTDNRFITDLSQKQLVLLGSNHCVIHFDKTGKVTHSFKE